VSVIALGVRLTDFRRTAKGPQAKASAIIVQRAVSVRRRSKWNGGIWRRRRIGCVWCPRRDDGRILEQDGRVVLRREHGTCHPRGGERENATSNKKVDQPFHGSPLLEQCAEPIDARLSADVNRRAIVANILERVAGWRWRQREPSVSIDSEMPVRARCDGPYEAPQERPR
jgi:hypothetical protein